ncbi:DUF2065 domain-containing protein [Antarcticirhabdus aurantiaca]|uniref:DUF2065 domain-containing protein n=1 Tax=Antarcticirhabdus aurantiaca TaxID=2606717 RepID=A0ACD4NIC0_9HYPH|nr:DUF2065 domain-containing protein [Antarcticirhabdus aurantiaca]WAJ26491.1 DUF2065 domain-containing protein [Jeongeuplla avenae]
MTDFLCALGLLLVIEGVFYALFPEASRRLGRLIQEVPDTQLRRSGLFAAVAGVGIVWLVRG